MEEGCHTPKKITINQLKFYPFSPHAKFRPVFHVFTIKWFFPSKFVELVLFWKFIPNKNEHNLNQDPSTPALVVQSKY